MGHAAEERRDIRRAGPLLAQFNLVGTTEAEDEFLDCVCLVLGVGNSDCAQTKVIANNDPKNAHEYPPHAKVADFSTAFQAALHDELSDEWANYNATRALWTSQHLRMAQSMKVWAHAESTSSNIARGAAEENQLW